MSHVNIQINIQYVIGEKKDQYGKVIAERSVREERINLTGETPGIVFERARAALDVLNS